jgi:glutamate synthase (NADPH) small chain
MLCPKCRRPLEGDEEYICCGTASIDWRCADCGKVSEGFAFPYGTCPLCGGHLAVLDPRQIEDAKALDAVRMAFEIELGGQAFYTRAASEATQPELKDLFAGLAAMEHEHMETLARRYHADVPAPSEAFQIECAAIYAGIGYRPDDPGNLFQIAIVCEERAVAFFSDQSGQAKEGSVERQLFRELAAEERDHVQLLATEYERWQAGKPGLL